MLAEAGPMPPLERCEDPDDREETGAKVGQRHARFDGRAVGIAGHRHDSRDALRDEIESTLRTRRSGLAVAGNGRVNQSRIPAGELVVTETERLHDAGPVVLD